MTNLRRNTLVMGLKVATNGLRLETPLGDEVAQVLIKQLATVVHIKELQLCVSRAITALSEPCDVLTNPDGWMP